MREKLAALEDLNELLEEPVEEQVSYIFLFFLNQDILRRPRKFEKIFHLVLTLLSKGQLISKGNFSVFNSPKKRT